MNKQLLITLPNAHLRQSSKKIGVINDDILQLIERMQDITLEWEAKREHEVGVALAAIQIDVPLRVVVVRNDFDNKADKTFRAFINPVITKYEGKLLEDIEGCLSVKDLYGRVSRHSKVRIKALDVTGKTVRFSAEGFLARIFQHEIDHTNGKVFIDHIKGQHDAFYMLNTGGELESIDYDTTIANDKALWGE